MWYGGETGRCTRRSCTCLLFFSHSMLIQGLGVSLFIFSFANHAAGVPTVITHPSIQAGIIYTIEKAYVGNKVYGKNYDLLVSKAYFSPIRL